MAGDGGVVLLQETNYPVMPVALASSLRVADPDGAPKPLPAWALMCMQLGWASRVHQDPNYRLLFAAILPTRRLASAFVALGATLAAGASFAEGFCWKDLRALPPGTKVYWRHGNHRCHGETRLPNPGAPELACIEVMGGLKASIGSVWAVGPATFEVHGFSVERVPTRKGHEDLSAVVALHQALGLGTTSAWGRAQGTEALVIGNQRRFTDEADSVELSVAGQGSVFLTLRDALSVSSASTGAFSKVSLQSPGRQDMEPSVPLTILDGPLAADQLVGMLGGNYLVLLERSEFSQEFRNRLLGLVGEATIDPVALKPLLPNRLPRGVELGGFAFQVEG